MFDARNISVSRAGKPILSDVSFRARDGEVVAICGPNGAGKSTLLSVLACDLSPDVGRVSIDGKNCRRMRAADLARLRAVLEQTPSLSGDFTVRELVEMGTDGAVGSPDETATITRKSLAAVGMEGFEGARVARLSGGERARAHLARVLAQLAAGRTTGGGRYMLLDEPTASLDPLHQIATMRAARRAASDGIGVVVVSHDINLATAFADRIVFMREGRIVADGPVRETMTEAMLLAVYDIDIRVTIDPDGSIHARPNYRGAPTAGEEARVFKKGA